MYNLKLIIFVCTTFLHMDFSVLYVQRLTTNSRFCPHCNSMSCLLAVEHLFDTKNRLNGSLFLLYAIQHDFCLQPEEEMPTQIACDVGNNCLPVLKVPASSTQYRKRLLAIEQNVSCT